MNFSEELLNIICEITNNPYHICNERTYVLQYWKNNLELFMKSYYLLADDESKTTFINLLRYNMAYQLSGKSIQNKYSLYPDQEWNQLLKKANDIKYVDEDYKLDRIETFLLEGYNYKNICSANEGDYVLDCGSYTGNTTIYFSKRVGPTGKVFAFEPMPETFKKLESNINLKNVEVYNCAISNESKILHFSDFQAPGSHVTDSKNFIPVYSTSIDEFVAKNNIQKIDFIKMDIEGSELNALDGAIETCRKFKPKLAICIYHKAEDFITIPQKILETEVNYKFFLKHNSNVFYETVLFGLPCDVKEEVTVDKIDLEHSNKYWQIFDNLYNIKEIFQKETLLKSYIEALKPRTNVKIQCIFGEKFSFVIFPQSKGNKIYYAIQFLNQDVITLFHIDKDYQSIFNKIIIGVKNLHDILITEDSDGAINAFFHINKINDINYVVSMLLKLIEKTYPILSRHNFVS